MTDYGKSKYGDAIAEEADAIVNNGFAVETYGDVDSIGHYALVDVAAGRVILRTDSQGFVDVHYGPASKPGDPRAFRALMAEWARILTTMEDGGED